MLDACRSDVLLACLWVAAAEGAGELSGDGWEYWRGWMVSRGRRRYESIVSNPDVLAELFTDLEDLSLGELVEYSGIYAYYAATGGKPDLDAGDYAYRPASGVEAPEEIFEPSVVETWPDRSGWGALTQGALVERFPKLRKRFGEPTFIDAYRDPQ